MNLKKAIQLLTFEDKATLPPRNDDFWNAIRLLIEAGKQIEVDRGDWWVPPEMLLPGETED